MATTVTLSQPASQEIKFITLKPNGTPLAGFADGYMGVGGFNLNAKGSMCELKQAEVEFVLDFGGGENWDNKQIIYLPGMFVSAGQTQPAPVPGIGWKFTITPGMAAGTYPMAWIGAFGVDNMVRNYECKLTFVNNTTKIIVKHKFYVVYDEEDFLSVAITPQNAWRWQKTNYNTDPVINQVPNSTFPFFDMSCMYGNILKKYGYYMYVKNTTTSENGNLYGYASVAWGFVNRRYQNGGPGWTAPSFEFSVAGIASGSNLSHTQATKVRFRAENTFGTDPTNCFAYLIRTDSGLNINNTFLNTYSYPFPLSAAEITTVGGTGTINTAIKAPSTALAFVSGAEWDVSFHIDHTKLIVGAKYKVIVIWYANPADVAPFPNQEVTSYESEELTAFFIPPYEPDTCKGFEFNKAIVDYKNILVGEDCIITVPEDRLKFGGGFDTAVDSSPTFGDCILSRLGLALPLNDVRRWLKTITVEIYEEYTVGPDTYKNVFQRESIVRTAPNVYNIPTAFEFYSLNWSEGFIVDYSLRVRYEPGVVNMESYLNGVLIPPASNQNWVNKTLQVRFDFEFEYFDYSPTFTEVYSSYFLMCVAPYENDNVDPVILCDGDEPGSGGLQADAVLFCHPGPCLPGDTSPSVAGYQGVGELPLSIPMGLTVLFNNWPTFAGIFRWNGTSFVLEHTVVKDDVVCTFSKYVQGDFVPHAINTTFDTETYAIDDGCPFEGSASNCDNYILCKGDQLCIDFLLDLAECEEYLVIGTIDRPIWGIMNIQEEENEEGELPQESSGHISLPLTYWGENPYKPCVGTICIDSTNLNVGTTYKVSIMAKRTLSLVPPCPEFRTIEIDLATETIDPDAGIYRLIAQTTIADTAGAVATVYYLDNPSKIFATQVTSDTTGWAINNDEDFWQIGDGEINILIRWADKTCGISNNFMARIEFKGGSFTLLEILDFGPDGFHIEGNNYQARLSLSGGSSSGLEVIGFDWFRKYIDLQRDKILRFNPFFGVGMTSAMVPFMFNADGTLTPLGNFVDGNTGFVGGDYTQNGTSQGIQGDGSSYIDTGFNISTIAEFGLDDCSLGLFYKNIAAANSIDIGVLGGSARALISPYIGGDKYMTLNAATYGADHVAVPSLTPGVYICSRLNAVSIKESINNINMTDPNASLLKENLSVFVFATNGLGLFSTSLISGYMIGKGLTDVEMKRFTAAWKFLLLYTGKR